MWARIELDKVVELTHIDPEGRFSDSLIWVECDSMTKQNWDYKNGGFSPPVQNSGELEFVVRILRDSYLSETQWLLDRNRDEQDAGDTKTITSEQLRELLVYRQALRDFPQSRDFPNIEKIPPKPLWLV